MTLDPPSHADRSLSIKIDAGAPREFILRSFASGSPTGGRDRASCRHRRLHRKLAASAVIVLAAIRKGQFLHYQVAGPLASLRGGQSVFAYVAIIKQRKKPNAGASSSPRERDHQPVPAARAQALGMSEETLPRLRGNEGHGDKT